MQHAKPPAGLSARALPVILLSATAAALTGLALLPAAGQPAPPVVRAQLQTAVQPLSVVDEAAVEERTEARASRGRRVEEREAAERAAAEAAAKAAAEAAAAAKAAAEAAAKEAAAKAAAEAAAKKKAAARAPAALRSPGGVCPVPNASFTDTWGAARSGGRSHQGTDLLAPYGSPVYAVASGTVRAASSSAGGISLYLRADNGETYFYAHNAENVVTSGRVAAGDLIARVGSTGNAGDTNHVHFERQVGGRSVNPYAFLRSIC